MMPLRERMQDDRLLICVHSGASNSAPENAMSDLRKTLDAVAHMVEIDAQIPTFHQAIELLHGKKYLNIEIKPQRASHESARDIASIIKTIDDYGMIPYTVFSSFDHSALVFVKSLGIPALTLALNVPGDERMPSRVVKTCGADAFGCSLAELTSLRAQNCHHNKIPLGVYTVNTPEELEYAVNFGVNAVVSNMPEIIVNHYNTISNIF